jgi:hypothetical protein
MMSRKSKSIFEDSSQFLQSKRTSVTALEKRLPLRMMFLTGLYGSWERCEGGLSGHQVYDECVPIKNANSVWMAQLKIASGNFLQNHARKEGGKRSNTIKARGYTFKFEFFSCVNHSAESSTIVLMLRFPFSFC